MPIDLAAALPRLLPKAVSWAQLQSQAALERGRPLSPDEQADAQAAGVQRPHRVRVAVVDAIPRPDDEELRAAAEQAGLLGPDTVGLALGYATVLRSDFAGSSALLKHELQHVRQFECYGSIEAFLSVYLHQVVQFGYADAPLERQARDGGHDGAPRCETSATDR